MRKMERGTILKCINTNKRAWITQGHLYVVVYASAPLNAWVHIYENSGYVLDYPKHCFIVIMEP